MASRQNRGVKGVPRGLIKQKGKAKRRALGDIGNNKVTVGGVEEGKLLPEVSRPLTRGFCAQLLANAQAAAADKNLKKKPIAVNVDGNGAIPAKVPSQKNAEKKVVVISPDTEVQQVKEKKAAVALSARSKDEILLMLSSYTKTYIAILSTPIKDVTLMLLRPFYKPAQAQKEATAKAAVPRSFTKRSYTATVTARSKAACGLPKEEQIQDIDAGDADNELAVVEYVEDIYKFYKEAENERRVHYYMDSQPFTVGERAILIDWLIEVHLKFKLTSETLYLTINIVDRYLAVRSTSRRELQLVGITALLIASKYEEHWGPKVYDLVCISDRAYTDQEVREMEKRILGELEWYLTVPTPYVFLVRFIKAAAIEDLVSDSESAIMENMVYFVAEVGMISTATMLFCPSMIAASAVYVARCTLKKSPAWNKTLKLYTGFSEPQLMDCAKLLVNCHLLASTCKLYIFTKYSNTQLPPAKFLLPAF